MVIEKNILVVEDDENSAKMIKDLLQNDGYKVEIATNGEEGLKKYKVARFPVIITDIEMPQMDGNALIAELKDYAITPVIIVTTVHDSTDKIIDIMKKGVFDYLIKPINMKSLLFKVERAFEIAEQKKLKEVSDRERIIRLENQLEWYQFEDYMIHGDIKKLEKSIFNNLQISFNQGPGVGALVTLARLITNMSEKDGDFYKIPSEIFDLLDINIKMAEKSLDIFQKINNILSKELETVTISYVDFYELIKDRIEDKKPIIDINNNTVVFSDLKKVPQDFSVKVNIEELLLALTEIITNCCKFSQKGSNIVIMYHIMDNFINLDFISYPVKDEKGRFGIPIGYENVIFEPFVRLTKKTFEEFETLDFGLGLTMVDIIIKKLGGKISASNIIDFTNLADGSSVKVNFSVQIPIVRG